MVNTNGQAPRRDDLSDQPNIDRVRKVIEEVCKVAGASVAIEERLGDGDKYQPAQRRRLHVTYTGERPMPYPQWFKLVDSIDAALDPSGLIDWESSELSEENEQERMAAWAILPAAAD
ncbi:MAG: hypothetical protein ABR964_03520 [Tepidisphaeraceae bacterium]